MISYIKYQFQCSLSNFMLFSKFSWLLDLNFFLIKFEGKYQCFGSGSGSTSGNVDLDPGSKK